MVSIKSGILRWIIVLVSSGFYLVSLFMPVLLFAKDPPVMGTTALCWGWWGLLTGDFPWFANPAYFLALVFTMRKKFGAAQISVLIAIGLGALSLYVREWYFNEGGGTPVLRLGHAFHFWMTSFIVLLIGITIVRASGNIETTPMRSN